MPSDEDTQGEQPDRPSPAWHNYQLRSVKQISEACRQLLGPTFDYESVASEIWLEAWCTHGCTNTSLVPVPYAQIKRRCVDARRRRAVEQRYVEATPIELEATNGTIHDADVLRLIVVRAGLSTLEHEIVYRHLVHDQTVSDIAERTGHSVSTVSKTLSVALAKLESAIRATGDAE